MYVVLTESVQVVSTQPIQLVGTVNFDSDDSVGIRRERSVGIVPLVAVAEPATSARASHPRCVQHAQQL